MPSQNVVKFYKIDSFYHLYNRGVAKDIVFHDNQDFAYFLKLFKRHLDPSDKSVDNQGKPYTKYHHLVELAAYCLMPNHFHLLAYQKNDTGGIVKLMRSVATAYSMYYNKRYARVGPVFQGRYKARQIKDDSDLMNIYKYIHRNPEQYLHYPWSSLPYYRGVKSSAWLQPARVQALFDGGCLTYLEQ
jgi:putative transposase